MMSTTKTLWLSFMIPLLAVIATAQQPTCSVKLDQVSEASELRGFRLGMTYEQVKARVPQVSFPPPDQFGVAKTTINPAFDPSFDKPSFEGVRTISMDFLDGKLVTLWIGYDGSFKWQKFDEFVAGMSKALNLPSLWPSKGRGQELTCADSSAFASMIAGSPALRITNEAAQETIATRRAEAQAAAEAAKAAADAVVIGDTRTKLYYPNDCDDVDSLPAANRVSFKDKDEAERAGYKRAKVCP
jgi:hypothetical protein